MTMINLCSEGVVALVQGSKNVVGVATPFVAMGVNPGDVFRDRATGAENYVDSVVDDNNLTLIAPWVGDGGAAREYDIIMHSNITRTGENATLLRKALNELQLTGGLINADNRDPISSDGEDGQGWLNTVTGQVFSKKNGAWVGGTLIKGETGGNGQAYDHNLNLPIDNNIGDDGQTGADVNGVTYIKQSGIWVVEGSIKGVAGDSAYQVWLNNGNSGTVQDYLGDIAGADGDISAATLAAALALKSDTGHGHTALDAVILALQNQVKILKFHSFSSTIDYTRTSETEGTFSDAASFSPVSSTSKFLILYTLHGQVTTEVAADNDFRFDYRLGYFHSVDAEYKSLGSRRVGSANIESSSTSSGIMYNFFQVMDFVVTGQGIVAHASGNMYFKLRGECAYSNNEVTVNHTRVVVVEYE